MAVLAMAMWEVADRGELQNQSSLLE